MLTSNGETGLKEIYMRLQVKPIFIHTYGSVPFNSREGWPTTATSDLQERFPSGYYAPTSFGREEKEQNHTAAR